MGKLEWAGFSEKQKLEELQKANRELTNEKNKYLSVFESIYDPIILVDKDNNIENMNYTAAEVFFNEAVSGMKYYGNINTDKELDWLNEELTKFIKLNENEAFQEKTIITKNSQKTYLIKFKKMLDVSEKYRGTVIIFNDITESKERTYQLQEINASLKEEIAIRTKIEDDLKASELQFRQSESRLIAAQLMAHVGNWELNIDTGKIWASEEAYNIYGIEYRSQYLPVDLIQELIFLEYRESVNNALIGLITRKEKYDVEYKIKNAKTGEGRFVHSKAILVVDETGNASKVVGTIQDITERKEKEIEISYLSYHDHLTGLYNRRFYEEELKRLDTERNLPLTIVIGDVNGLKLINDSFGHDKGDELIKKVAEVIKNGCRADDIIARLGGDEFVILLPKTNNFEAEQIIKRIQEETLKEELGSIDISVSFGWKTKNKREEKTQDLFKKAEDHMYMKKLFEGPSMRGKTIQTIVRTLHEKIREEQHSYRVSILCKRMGEALGLSESEIQELHSVGLLYDIGKIAIEDTILNKPGKLTNDEWEEIKRHPEIGYRILSTVNDMAEISEYVLAHHERWDGLGYPKGLKREEIPLQSRIINIADAYDAMTSARSYCSVLSEKAAIEELQANAGLQFDPQLVTIFIDKVLVNDEPIPTPTR